MKGGPTERYLGVVFGKIFKVSLGDLSEKLDYSVCQFNALHDRPLLGRKRKSESGISNVLNDRYFPKADIQFSIAEKPCWTTALHPTAAIGMVES